MTAADVALLALRVTLGVVWLAHGLRKLGWGNPAGLAGFRASIARRGFRPPTAWAVVAVFAEVAGGGLVLVGLLSPVAGAALLAQSLMILVLVAPRGFWHDREGVEYPLVLAASALVVTLAGPGAISVDAALGAGYHPLLGPVAAAAAAGGVAIGLLTRGPETPRA